MCVCACVCVCVCMREREREREKEREREREREREKQRDRLHALASITGSLVLLTRFLSSVPVIKLCPILTAHH